MTVPAVTPVPVTTWPIAKLGEVTDVTVRVVVEMVPVKAATCCVAVAVMEVGVACVCEMLMVYVPMPPRPVPRAVITVFAVTPVPEMT